jgi:hypothetical protein
MSEDMEAVADEAIDKGAKAAKHMTKFIPLVNDVGGGLIALTAAIIATNLAFGKFRSAWMVAKKVTS